MTELELRESFKSLYKRIENYNDERYKIGVGLRDFAEALEAHTDNKNLIPSSSYIGKIMDKFNSVSETFDVEGKLAKFRNIFQDKIDWDQ